MAPKKTIENKSQATTKKSQQKRPAKPRVKQLKPKLKTPTVIKIKIPVESLKNSKVMSPKGPNMKKEQKLTKKQLTLEKKLELANEVAAAQLGYQNHMLDDTEQVVIAVSKPKRGRKKKVVEPVTSPEPSVCTSAPTDSEDAFEVTPKKRKYVSKNPTNAKKSEAAKTNKDKKPASLTLKKNTKQDTITSLSTTKPKRIIKPKKPSPLETLVESKPKKKKPKPVPGKTDKNSHHGVQQSPSILEQVEVQTLKKEHTGTTESDSTGTHPNVEPRSIDSRKTSSASECLSWTKDISSSSTTTCVTVCSKDIVRIDKKMPFVKLSHVDKDLNIYANMSSSSSDSETSSEPSPKRASREFTQDVESRSLDLSTSSISPNKSRASFSCRNSVNNDDVDKITYALDKLTSKLQNFDLEIINWIGYEKEEVDVDTRKFQDKIFRMLKEENIVLNSCRQLKSILSDTNYDEYPNEECRQTNEHTREFIDSNYTENDTNITTGEDNNANEQPISQNSDENNFTSDRVRYIPFDQSCDDDDALSLFAESITGIESSRRNSSATSICTNNDFEEYVPQALNNEKWEPAKKISYTPTCIAEKHDVRTKPVCEKQNADSTSIYKESEPYKESPLQEYTEKNIPPLLSFNPVMPNKKRPCLISNIFKPLTGAKSILFRGVCFYNLLSSCKTSPCRYPHHIPSHKEVTANLMRLSEEMFIQEYMLLRNWPILRRQYVICFVHECARRDLSRILVEMGLDAVIKANDRENYQADLMLKVVIIECVLLHLNNLDLAICDDLLIYRHQGVLLCEIFMQVIANTQNFSRFKPIFIKLTKFILEQGRSFPLDVASQILERICILPSEPVLLEAMMGIVRSTDQGILRNSMLGHFENQLSVASKELYDELLKLKSEAVMNRPVLQNLYESSPRPAPEIETVTATALVSERENRYTSPDTTNLDTMNKPSEDPTITRSIDFNRPQIFGKLQHTFSNSNSSNDSAEEFRPQVVSTKPNFKSWRDRSIFNNIRGLSPGIRHNIPRPLTKRHIHQQMNFGHRPSKFPRRTGPDFF